MLILDFDWFSFLFAGNMKCFNCAENRLRQLVFGKKILVFNQNCIVNKYSGFVLSRFILLRPPPVIRFIYFLCHQLTFLIYCAVLLIFVSPFSDTL